MIFLALVYPVAYKLMSKDHHQYQDAGESLFFARYCGSYIYHVLFHA